MANLEIYNLKKQNISLEKQRKCAWAKYYGEVNDRHEEQLQRFTHTEILIKTIEETADLPKNIVNELNDLHKELKKCVECPICYEVLDTFELSNCGHKYCKTCLDKLIDTSNKCALCRKQLKWKKK